MYPDDMYNVLVGYVYNAKRKSAGFVPESAHLHRAASVPVIILLL